MTGLLLGILVGAILVLTGAGGGILAVPALVVGLGWPMQQAAPVALIAVAGGAALGAAEGLRKKLVRYSAALLMAVTGVPVTGFGVLIAHTLSQRVLLALFACVMLLVATRLFLQAQHWLNEPEKGRLGHIDPSTGRFNWNWLTTALLTGIGALTGFMTGLLGVGGGFVIVPLLRRLTDVSMHGIVATSLLVIALVGAGGVATTLLHGTTVPLELTVYFSLATACGMMLGRLVSSHLSARHVQMGFSLVLVVVAAGLLVNAFFSAD